MNLITRLITAKARLKLMLIAEQLIDLRADVMTTPGSSPAHGAIMETIKREENEYQREAEFVEYHTGEVSEMTVEEAVILAMFAAMLCSAIVAAVTR